MKLVNAVEDLVGVPDGEKVTINLNKLNRKARRILFALKRKQKRQLNKKLEEVNYD